jgi:hypothetical protein
MLQFAIKPMWGINYVTHERFKLPQLVKHVEMGGSALSISRYFSEMLDPSMNWGDVAEMVQHWNGQFCLKGVMSVADARRAVEVGCTGLVVSNHGGRSAMIGTAPMNRSRREGERECRIAQPRIPRTTVPICITAPPAHAPWWGSGSDIRVNLQAKRYAARRFVSVDPPLVSPRVALAWSVLFRPLS